MTEKLKELSENTRCFLKEESAKRRHAFKGEEWSNEIAEVRGDPKTGNGGKSPIILKRGTAENHP